MFKILWDRPDAFLLDTSALKPLKIVSPTAWQSHSHTCFYNGLKLITPSSHLKNSSPFAVDNILRGQYLLFDKQITRFLIISCCHGLTDHLRQIRSSDVLQLLFDQQDPNSRVLFKSLIKTYQNAFGSAKHLVPFSEEDIDEFLNELFAELDKSEHRAKEISIERLLDFTKKFEVQLIHKIYLDLAETIFNQAGLSASEIIERYERDYRYTQQIPYDERKLSALHSSLQRLVANHHGYQEDLSWNPTMPVEALISMLKNKGIVLMAGLYGNHYYSEAPEQKLVNGIEILFWKSKSFKSQVDSHHVLIIGASKQGYANNSQDLVYFIDPNEMNCAKFPIYMLSYKSFCERLVGNSGIRLSPLDLNEKYFIHHPALAPKAQDRTKPQPVLPQNNVVRSHSNTSNNHAGFFRCNTTTAAVAASALAVGAIAMALSSRYM